MIQLVKKLIDKLFTLTAFISAVCLAVHYAPVSLIFEDYSLDPFDKMRYTLAPLFSLMMLASAVLLFLDLFSLKYKNLPHKAWKIFAAIGVVPILPFALICLAFSFLGFIDDLF